MEQVHIEGRTFELFIRYESIKDRVMEIAKEISYKFEHLDPVFLPILNGSFMFTADLLKNVNIKSSVQFIKVASYQGDSSSGQVKSLLGLSDNLAGKHIIILEDIIDTGLTMKYLLEELNKQNPASIFVVTLLYKKESLQYPIIPDIACFDITQEFVVGYGLDYDGYGRNLRHIYKEKGVRDKE
ncbi:MAG: hypoxanthine phosphoribosyltransferase [Bacteroidota bacterium]|nr:hypoxanthine phosphoribosyltransferase [Bacteroidota bacterium]